MSRFRDVCTLGTHDDIMHYVRTLNIYELFNDTVRPASINYAFFHPVPRARMHIAESLSERLLAAIGPRIFATLSLPKCDRRNVVKKLLLYLSRQ